MGSASDSGFLSDLITNPLITVEYSGSLNVLIVFDSEEFGPIHYYGPIDGSGYFFDYLTDQELFILDPEELFDIHDNDTIRPIHSAKSVDYLINLQKAQDMVYEKNLQFDLNYLEDNNCWFSLYKSIELDTVYNEIIALLMDDDDIWDEYVEETGYWPEYSSIDYNRYMDREFSKFLIENYDKYHLKYLPILFEYPNDFQISLDKSPSECIQDLYLDTLDLFETDILSDIYPNFDDVDLDDLEDQSFYNQLTFLKD